MPTEPIPGSFIPVSLYQCIKRHTVLVTHPIVLAYAKKVTKFSEKCLFKNTQAVFIVFLSHWNNPSFSNWPKNVIFHLFYQPHKLFLVVSNILISGWCERVRVGVPKHRIKWRHTELGIVKTYLGRKIACSVYSDHENRLVHSVFDGKVEYPDIRPIFHTLQCLIIHRLALLISTVWVRVFV